MIWVESPVHTVCSFYRSDAGFAHSVSMDAEANARLIASAPAMKEALEGVIAFNNWANSEGGVTPPYLRDVWKRAEAALAASSPKTGDTDVE